MAANSAVPGLNTKGPFSFTAPYNDEHPGPPFSHKTTGVLASDSTSSKVDVIK